MDDFLRFLILPLLSAPDKLRLTSSPSQIVIDVATADVGRLIGKHGSVINAIRILTQTYCTLHHLPLPHLTLAAPPKTD